MRSGIGVAEHRSERLADFVGNRSRQLPHRCDAVRVRELHLYLRVCPFRSLPTGEVEHKTDAFTLAPLERGGTDQHRHTRTVFSKVFFFMGLSSSTRLLLCHSAVGCLPPFGRCPLPPFQTASARIPAVIPSGAQKGAVS